MRYDIILWDVDGTLLDFPYSQSYALKACMADQGYIIDDAMVARYSQINDSWWKRLELSEVTKDELLLGRFIDFFREYGFPLDKVREVQPAYQVYLGNVYRYLENSLEVCKALEGKCRQFAVTNGMAMTQRSKLQLSGFTALFEDIFISGEIGYEKPHKEFFDAIFDKLQITDKSRILIVGDSLSSDMKGGKNAGIDTCFYNPLGKIVNVTKEELPITWEIKKLEEIIPIVEG